MKILVLCHSCGNDSSTTGKADDCVECLKGDRVQLAMLSAVDIPIWDNSLAMRNAIALRERVLKEAGLL